MEPSKTQLETEEQKEEEEDEKIPKITKQLWANVRNITNRSQSVCHCQKLIAKLSLIFCGEPHSLSHSLSVFWVCIDLFRFVIFKHITSMMSNERA